MAIERLRAVLQQGGMPAGTRLPAVPELAGMLGATRFATWEALRQLEQEGVLRLMPGRSPSSSARSTVRPSGRRCVAGWCW